MALTAKLLRVEPIGLGGQSAFVGIENDSPAGMRIVYLTGIPARLSPTQVWAWIQERYTPAQGWTIGRDVVGRELEIWRALWQANQAHTTIASDLAVCDTDLTAIAALAIPTGAKDVLSRITNRQKRTLTMMDRMISVTEHIIRVLAPLADESPGGNGT